MDYPEKGSRMSHIYQPTDIVLAKVKGYPAWPALIVPNELIPASVLRNRSKSHILNTKNDKDENPDESMEVEVSDDEDLSNYIIYSDILKFRKFDDNKSQYCVKFFCDDSYIWVKNNDIQLLSPETCNQWLKSSKKKNKKLIPAYEMASRGSEGIDVWEFIEYGSSGKPEEDEYVEEEENEEIAEEIGGPDDEDFVDDSDKVRAKPKRSSSRQEQKRVREAEKEAQINVKNKRNTRSSKVNQVEEREELDDSVFTEPKPKKTRTNGKATVKARKMKLSKVKKAVEKYHYEDDEDWTLVGLGLQDLLPQKTVSPLVNKLSQKKNYEHHIETKLDLSDRLSSINRLIAGILLSYRGKKLKITKEDFEIVIDELDLALSVKGAGDEFITSFQCNNELLINLRLLLNLRHEELEEWDLMSSFQEIYKAIYNSEFALDEKASTLNSALSSPEGKKPDEKLSKLEMEVNG